jgi:hypothetical protein
MSAARATTEDLQHLRLLSIFYVVVGAFAALAGTIPVIHFVIGIMLVSGQLPAGPNKGGPPVEMIGWFFVVIGGLAVLLGWCAAVGMWVAARMLVRHRRYTFCMVMAGVACLFQPVGTVLGVFTIIVLMRPGVKDLFDAVEADVLEPGSDPWEPTTG